MDLEVCIGGGRLGLTVQSSEAPPTFSVLTYFVLQPVVLSMASLTVPSYDYSIIQGLLRLVNKLTKNKPSKNIELRMHQSILSKVLELQVSTAS